MSNSRALGLTIVTAVFTILGCMLLWKAVVWTANVDGNTGKPVHEIIQESDPRWNCMTMGNHKCGPNWVLWENYSVDGSKANTDCMALVGDTTILNCADGTVTSS